MKPLIRWTLGNPTRAGFEVLLEAVESWKSLYPEFDYCVCYNETNPKYIEELIKASIPIFNQVKNYQNNKEKYFWTPEFTAWKLVPPRLRLESHEIICDNDLIILKRLAIIDDFLASDFAFMCSALRRGYGYFDDWIPERCLWNSGFFGMPPRFPLDEEILKLQQECGQGKWKTSWDEQGMLSVILLRYGNYRIIPMSQIYNCLFGLKITSGVHFCGANSGHSKIWKQYKKMRLPHL